MDNPGEILRLCRLCLVKDQVNIPIFEEQGDIRQIFLKISSCLPVTVSRDDQLPKKICDGCSNKLDLLYEFWNTSANAEKTLLSWLGQAGVKDADETISAVAQQIAKPAETQVKQEDLEDGHAISQDNFGLQSFDEDTKDEAEPPPRKRARRTAAVKAQISIAPESDDDDDDIDNTEAMTKVEGESEESDGEDRDPSYGEVPGTSADDQAGPSGVGKDGVEAPYYEFNKLAFTGELGSGGDKEKKHQCPICENTFTLRRNLRRHIINIHEKLVYPCDICNEVLSTPRSLDRHKLIVHDIAQDLLEIACEKCGKTFKYHSQLTVHLKKAHSDKESEILNYIKCPVTECSKIFRSTPSLNYHLLTHQEEKPTYPCLKCSKVFSHPLTLKRHHKIHNGYSETHTCHICGKNVTTAASLSHHIRTHTGEKPCICEVCGKGFGSNKMLKTHSVVHTKERKHICKICQKSFTQRGTLTAHIRKNHPLEQT